MSGKIGVSHLSDASRRGDIWRHEGRIVHAETEDLSGEEAVYALAIWRSGEFRFEAGVAIQPITHAAGSLKGSAVAEAVLRPLPSPQ